MSARSKARKRALDILYQSDVRGDELAVTLAAEAKRAAAEPAREASWLYARDWKLERMPAVDRAILRIGVWELLHNDEVPTAVAIDEAVELAKEFSTDDSGSFVHGVLARIARAG